MYTPNNMYGGMASQIILHCCGGERKYCGFNEQGALTCLRKLTRWWWVGAETL